jgi:hypothetical protein
LDELVEDESPVAAFDPKIVAEVEATETPPDINSEAWHDYVMRQFMNEELEKGNPVRDGLVRVTEKLIGPIIKREIVSYSPATAENRGSATVHIRITIVPLDTHVLSGYISRHGMLLTEDGIAECNSRNTPAPFHLHQAATASSKAEAQALRKALRLRRTVSADEITPDDMAFEGDVYIPDSPIVGEQITVIDLLCKRINISVLEFINTGSIKYAFIEQIPQSKAQSMTKYLGEILSANKLSPVKTPYDPHWRTVNQKKANNESTD